MLKAFTIFLGGCLAIVLMLSAIWLWANAVTLGATAARSDAMLWAARSLAIAAAAGAQVIIITFVLGRMYHSRGLHDVLRLTAGLVCCIAAVSAAALGLAARG